MISAGDTVTGNLSSGQVYNLDFADLSSVACFPGTQIEIFGGNTVLYALSMPNHAKLTVTATPESGTDIAIYAYQIGTTYYDVPPNISTVVTCEASPSKDPFKENPGEPESVLLTSINNPYTVVIAVTSWKDISSGGYTLKTVLEN